jgi:hypothetical protein
MMVFSVQQVKYEFLAYIKEFDPTFSNWYVGLADQPRQALFEHHGVRDAEDPWLYKQLLTNRAARTVPAIFHRTPEDGGRSAGGAIGKRGLRLFVQGRSAHAAIGEGNAGG